MVPRQIASFRFRLLSVLAALALAAPALTAASWSPVGVEFQINGVSSGHQFDPAVASDAEGRSVVVWLDEFRQGVFAQRYDAEGRAAGGEFRVDDDLSGPFVPINFPIEWPPIFGPRVAWGADGGFLVVWPTQSGVRARAYDARGVSLTGSFAVSLEGLSEVDVAGRPGGGYVVVWTALESSKGVVFRQLLDASGNAVGGLYQVDQAPIPVGPFGVRWPRVAVNRAGGFVVTWEKGREVVTGSPDEPESDIWARRFNPAGQPIGDELRVNPGADDDQYGAMPVFHADGGFSVIWNNVVPAGGGFDLQTVAQRFNAAGARVGSPVPLGAERLDLPPPVVAAGPDGKLVVLWTTQGPRDPNIGVIGRVFDDRWLPLTDVFQVNTYVEFDQTNPALAVDAQGRFFAVWMSGEQPVPRTPPPVEWGGQDGSSFGVFGQRFSVASDCRADATGLCLNNSRFRVEVTWTDPRTGNSGVGRAVPRTGDTGMFWFFGPSNVELIVKVLDGRSVNGHFWVFYGSLTDVEFLLTVTDTATGEQEIYHNPPYNMASSADTSAFAGSLTSTKVHSVVSKVPASVGLVATPAPQEAVLRLAGNRFTAEVTWTDPRTGNTGTGHAVPLTGDTGAFWFFGESNLELVVKVLDGRPVNGAFWVFYGSLSDVEYTLTVTDTVTGARKQYRNPPFTLASRGDTSAFRVPGP